MWLLRCLYFGVYILSCHDDGAFGERPLYEHRNLYGLGAWGLERRCLLTMIPSHRCLLPDQQDFMCVFLGEQLWLHVLHLLGAENCSMYLVH